MKKIKAESGKRKAETNSGGAPESRATERRPLPVGESMPVAYSLIRPDPNQPRKTFSEESLKELAASIEQNGVLQPLILERMPAKYKIEEPDLTSDEYQVWDLTNLVASSVFKDKDRAKCMDYAGAENLGTHFRIVCGERRWRAAGTLKLVELPAVVYAGLTPEQRFAFQFIENNQRENITALEEAEALKQQLEARRHADAAFAAETLAAELGMSRASFYERLKLTRLHPPIRAALLKGTISTSIAGEIAKLPTPKAQEQLLAQIEEDSEYNPMSVRDVQELIDDDYVKQLSTAPFDTKLSYGGDSVAGILDACTACPFRTGNMVDEFPDLKNRPNVCTNPECFGRKCKAYWTEDAKDQAQRGKTVLTEKEFRKQKADYIAGDKHEYAQNKSGTFEELMGKHKPEPVLVATAEGLKKFYPKAEVPAADDRLIRRAAFAKTLIPDLAKAISAMKDVEAWKLLAATVTPRPWEKERTKLMALVKTDKARVLVDGLINSLDEAFSESVMEPSTVKMWRELGVDLEALFEKHEQENAPTLALPKSEPKQKALLEVPVAPKKPKIKGLSAKAKAHIAAAAKARWAKIKAKGMK